MLRRFTFDKVYDVAATQEYLFNTSVAPVVDEVLAGYSCTVFAYGQTGTGKTYTMEGKKEEGGTIEVSGSGAGTSHWVLNRCCSRVTPLTSAGIIARAVSRVFDSLATSHGDNHVKISFLEIYNEVRTASNPLPCPW
jgi:kinesin family protein 11